jgi:transaldolase
MCASPNPNSPHCEKQESDSSPKDAKSTLARLKVKIYADGADKATMLQMYANPYIQGFTTNPTLMRKSAVGDYRVFAKEVLDVIKDRPISFEVFADDFNEMEDQALEIASWGENVIVKIPVTNTHGEPADRVMQNLAAAGVKLNVTAVLTLDHVRRAADNIGNGAPGKVSVFAGRIADTGRDPIPVMAAAVELLRPYPSLELIWASPRELLNVFQADSVGCHVITATTDILNKLCLIGKDLHEYSLETVKMFYDDAQKAGYRISVDVPVLNQGAA